MCNELEGILSPAENHTARSGPGAAGAGEQDPTAPGVLAPRGGLVMPGLPCAAVEMKDSRIQSNTGPPFPKCLNHPAGPDWAFQKEKGLTQRWLPSVGGGLSLQPEHWGGPQRAPQGEGSAFGSLQTHEESSPY